MLIELVRWQEYVPLPSSIFWYADQIFPTQFMGSRKEYMKECDALGYTFDLNPFLPSKH